MKFFKQHIKKILSVSLMLILCFYVAFFGIKKAIQHEIYKQPDKQTTIYEIWHIETFEGGSKSRIEYLKTIARKLEKSEPENLFMIRSISPENLETELSQSTPDIISFGYGVGKIVLPFLSDFENCFNVRDELVESGMFSNKVYALPYIMSGYALITHGNLTNNFKCGTSPYCHPEKIYLENNFAVSTIETPYEAYKHFVNDKTATLLGTNRDVYRVDKLNNIGRLNCSITPCSTYTDLIQYIGICKPNETTKNFVKCVFSNENQQNLTNFSLYSVNFGKIYQTGIYSDMEDAIMKASIPNAFYV
ncbi:MAG: hypothetical protein ACI4L6_01635 [Candidatus Onthoplasma sp.]